MKSGSLSSVVIVSKAGRLGNRLFVSAYFIANALARGYRLFNPALDEYAASFEGSASDPFCSFPNDRASKYDPEVASQVREAFLVLSAAAGSLVNFTGFPGIGSLDIRTSHDAVDDLYDLAKEDFETLLLGNHLLLVKGWKFRDDVNLLRFHSEIAEYFAPVAWIRQTAETVLLEAREKSDLVIGVHIRQGDYRGWKNGVHYFETSQYAHWMHQAVALHAGKRISFVLCASDPIDGTLFDGLHIIDGPGTVVADLHALSLCDLIMGPPSTFSTWASYYGRTPLCMLQHHLQEVSLSDFVMHDKV